MSTVIVILHLSFNTQPPEGGWDEQGNILTMDGVSTHSRPKAAAVNIFIDGIACIVSTHSRPKAAELYGFNTQLLAGFNTQPPEGGCTVYTQTSKPNRVSTHSRPKAAVWFC